MKLSLDECEFFYLKLMTDAKSRKPDPSRLSAIKNIPTPKNVSTLQAFLGLANYYDNFISNMNELRASLKLFARDSRWNWSTECQSAFEEIKKH